jgi:lipopolysaccharide export system protein LptA
MKSKQHFYKIISFSRILVFLLPFFYFTVEAQVGNGSITPMNPNQVEFIRADSLIILNQPFMQVRQFVGNAAFRQGTTLLYCSMAILNETTNVMEAYGKVKIIQSDTVTITGDTAYYFGNDRKAKIFGKVKLDDHTINLSTKKMDYDLASHIAYYNTGGKIVDKKSVLTSKEGYYNTVTKLFDFKTNVKVIDKDGAVTADSLRYSTLSKEAFFVCPTTIISKNDTMYANRGSQYNTVTKISNFKGRSTIRTEEYIMTADTMIYDPPTEIGVANGDIVFISKKDKAILTGKHGRFNKKTGYTRVFGNALLKNIFEDDTLFLTGDTLVSLDNKETKVRKLYAYKQVLIYKTDFSGKCDSLSYNVSDSTIFFYQKPILWNNKNQSEADSINILLKNNKLSLMNMKGKCFVVSVDTLKNFNQIKGRKMVVNFSKDSKLEKVTVEGNGESIYFAVDEKNTLTGMNRVQCSKMNMNFAKSKIQRIAFLAKPEGKFSPPKETKEEDRQLDGFQWREAEKPTKARLLLKVNPPKVQGVKSRRDSVFVSNQEVQTPIPVKILNKGLKKKINRN